MEKKQFKGTKGKWKFDESLYVDTEREAVVETSQGGWTIAKVQDGSRNNNSSVIRANAQLTAAAPELLGALIDMIDLFEGYAHYGKSNQKAVGRAYEVINKALGL
jgi:hypothetical protein